MLNRIVACVRVEVGAVHHAGAARAIFSLLIRAGAIVSFIRGLTFSVTLRGTVRPPRRVAAFCRHAGGGRIGTGPAPQPRRVVTRSVITKAAFIVALLPGVPIALRAFGLAA